MSIGHDAPDVLKTTADRTGGFIDGCTDDGQWYRLKCTKQQSGERHTDIYMCFSLMQ